MKHHVGTKLVCLCDFPRSRDVAELRANMTFDPVKINLQQSQYQCEHNGRKSVCVTTDVCFVYTIKSDNKDSNFVAGEPHGHLVLVYSILSLNRLRCYSFLFFSLTCSDLQRSATT